jgi:hypothetical protein
MQCKDILQRTSWRDLHTSRFRPLLNSNSAASWNMVRSKEVCHHPIHTCDNYPVCKNRCSRKRDSTGKQIEEQYCSSCKDLQKCAMTDCDNHIVNFETFQNQTCLSHFLSTAPNSEYSLTSMKPPVANSTQTALEVWPPCTNALPFTCKRLSQTSDKQTTCYACSSSHLPCKNSCRGCPRHVRNNPDGNADCSTLHSKKKVSCPYAPPPCLNGCGRESTSDNYRYCETCRPLQCQMRINGKRSRTELSLTPRPLQPSALCTFAPYCSNVCNPSKQDGRCNACLAFATAPCCNQPLCQGRALQNDVSCYTCQMHGQPCCGPRGKGCPHNRRAKQHNEGKCLRCRRPPCRGFLGRPCARNNQSQNHLGKPCKACCHFALKAKSVRKKKVKSFKLTAPLQAPATRLFRKQPPSKLKRRYCVCSVPWCQKRRRLRIFNFCFKKTTFRNGRRCLLQAPPLSMTSYCKEHAKWFVPPHLRVLTKERCGFVAGFRAGLSDFGENDEQHIPKAAFGTPEFDGKCKFCGALSFKEEMVPGESGSGEARIFSLCCRKGFFWRLSWAAL